MELRIRNRRARQRRREDDPSRGAGALTFSQDRSLLFAVNAGSGNNLRRSVWAGKPLLALVSKTPSGGSEPVAVAENGGLVYVLNSGGAGSVVGFRLGFGGQLIQIENSTQFLSANDVAGASISFSPNGHFLLVTERLTNNIDAFSVKPNGTLAPAIVKSSPGAGAFSVRFAPNGDAIVSETGPATATNGSTVSSYSVLSNLRGTLCSYHSQCCPHTGRCKLLECDHSQWPVCLCLQRR